MSKVSVRGVKLFSKKSISITKNTEVVSAIITLNANES